jgi:hypothetical protein
VSATTEGFSVAVVVLLPVGLFGVVTLVSLALVGVVVGVPSWQEHLALRDRDDRRHRGTAAGRCRLGNGD